MEKSFSGAGRLFLGLLHFCLSCELMHWPLLLCTLSKDICKQTWKIERVSSFGTKGKYAYFLVLKKTVFSSEAKAIQAYSKKIWASQAQDFPPIMKLTVCIGIT
jgi:hypothetical protein